MNKIKKYWLKLLMWFKYWFFYRPLIRKLLKSKGVQEKRKLEHFTCAIYKSILLNKKMMDVEETNLQRAAEVMKTNYIKHDNFKEKDFVENKSSEYINKPENEN